MIQLAKKHRFLLSILSGVLMIVAFPFSGSLTPVIFISWVPLLLLESYISDRNYRSRKVFTHAYLTFFIYNIGTTWWVWNASIGGSLMAFFANTLIMALAFQLFHLTKKHVGKKEGYLSLPIFWISFEYLHYHWEASWTWLTLGNTFSIVPSWVQWYEFTGVLGGTLWVLLINLLIFRIYQNVLFKGETWRIQTPLIWLAGFLFIVPLSVSLITYFSYEEKVNPVEVVVVQPNIDPYNEKFVTDVDSQVEKVMTLAKSKVTVSTDLVLAPETAISLGFEEESFHLHPFHSIIIDAKRKMYDVPVCIGASTWKQFDKPRSRASFTHKNVPGYLENYNTSILIAENNQAHFVHKSKLVPGVEAIPFSNWLPFLEKLAIDLDGASGTLGIEDGPKILETQSMQFAPVVCYESIYGEWVAQQCKLGAQLICISTNDGWWKDTPGYRQHMSFARLRAIENRRAVARSANTGTSGFINQRGDILAASSWWEPAAMKQTLNLNDEQTFYMTYGDVLGRSLSFVSALLILLTFVRRFKKRFSRQ